MNYQIYSSEREKVDVRYNGVDISRGLSSVLAFSIYFPQLVSYSVIFKSFFRSADVKPIFSAFRDGYIPITCGLNRPDFFELIQAVIKDCPKCTYVPVFKYKLKFSFKAIFFGISKIPSLLKLNLSLKHTFYLISQMVYYCNVLDELESFSKSEEDGSRDKYVAFHSSFGIETVICSFFNLKHTTTYSLSHGLSYVNYKLYNPMDIVNGENITAKYVFVWGESSKFDLINNFGVPENRVIVAGHPKYHFKRFVPKENLKSVVILLGRRIYHDENLKLLSIVNNVANDRFIISVKLHPSLYTIPDYSELCEKYGFKLVDFNTSLTNLLSKNEFDIAISFNTTAYYEAYYNNLVSLRYSDKENEEYPGLHDKFVNEVELRTLLSEISSMDKQDLANKVDELLGYVFSKEVSYNKYLT